MAENVLEIKDLATYFYTETGVVKAVDGISYELEQGEILGIVGESGCGKSVSALSVMRLVPYPPGRIVRGQVLFEGEDLIHMFAMAMRHGITAAQIKDQLFAFPTFSADSKSML